MTYGEAVGFVQTFLRGDNSGAEPTPLHFKAALTEVALRCEPRALIAVYDGTQTDVLRFIDPKFDDDGNETKRYIKEPSVSDPLNEADPVGIDSALHLAVIFYVCSYLSNKFKDRYENKAIEQTSVYTANLKADDE